VLGVREHTGVKPMGYEKDGQCYDPRDERSLELSGHRVPLLVLRAL
jgi:hypothetical protein